jgi:hypothetical protein
MVDKVAAQGFILFLSCDCRVLEKADWIEHVFNLCF